MTFEEFRKLFNVAVQRFRKCKCSSMEFTLIGSNQDVPEKYFENILSIVHLKGIDLHLIKRYGNTVGILFFKKPCAKFNQLVGWLDRYAQWPHSQECLRAYIETRLYVADVCGKRGKWYPEDEKRKEYLCHNPAWCDRVKKRLQKMRNTGDTVIIYPKLIEEFENYDESIRNETELYGCVSHTLRFKVVTPGGKVKFDDVIY